MRENEFLGILSEESRRAEKQLKEFLEDRSFKSSVLGDEHIKYYLNLEEFILRGGKRLRPVALIMAYRGIAGGNGDEIYLPSISIELLHNATLIHDDIIDHDTVRRGGPTFHTKYANLFDGKARDPADFGLSVGIIGGNSLFNMGVESILSSEFNCKKKLKALSLYSEGFREVIEGVFLESLMAIRKKSDEDEYLTMIHLKTSSLFEKAILIGAALGGAGGEQLKALSQYAVMTGQAFQIQDDILGTFGAEKVTGKPSDSDIKEGKLTLLNIKLYEACDDAERKKLNLIYGNSEADEADIEFVRGLLRERGVLEYCSNLSDKLSERAFKALRTATPALNARMIDFFRELSRYVIKRNK